MRAGWVVVLVAFAGRAPAQVALDDGAPLPGGADVSRPLTPVELPLVAEPEPVRRLEELRRPARRGPLGPSWNGLEYLAWWPKAHPLPALVTANRAGAAPVLGDPGTVLLAGGRALGTPVVSGGRFTLGWAADAAQTRGYEVVYFFLGSRTVGAAAGGGRLRTVGIPYADAVTGREDAFAVPSPGAVAVATTTRVQGAQANAVGNLFDRDGLRVHGLLGYRFLQVHEGLAVAALRPSGFGSAYDEFAAHNRFHGGQLGLYADLSRGAMFCELTGKVALGGTFQVVRVDGATDGGLLSGGLFTGPTNIGRWTRGAFAVVPEGTLKLGLKWGEAGRVYVGYNFLYLSDAVRPGDQLDRVVNPANVPALGGTSPVLPDRPRPVFTRSEFWAQGLVIGLETRY